MNQTLFLHEIIFEKFRESHAGTTFGLFVYRGYQINNINDIFVQMVDRSTDNRSRQNINMKPGIHCIFVGERETNPTTALPQDL